MKRLVLALTALTTTAALADHHVLPGTDNWKGNIKTGVGIESDHGKGVHNFNPFINLGLTNGDFFININGDIDTNHKGGDSLDSNILFNTGYNYTFANDFKLTPVFEIENDAWSGDGAQEGKPNETYYRFKPHWSKDVGKGFTYKGRALFEYGREPVSSTRNTGDYVIVEQPWFELSNGVVYDFYKGWQAGLSLDYEGNMGNTRKVEDAANFVGKDDQLALTGHLNYKPNVNFADLSFYSNFELAKWDLHNSMKNKDDNSITFGGRVNKKWGNFGLAAHALRSEYQNKSVTVTDPITGKIAEGKVGSTHRTHADVNATYDLSEDIFLIGAYEYEDDNRWDEEGEFHKYSGGLGYRFNDNTDATIKYGRKKFREHESYKPDLDTIDFAVNYKF